jgi:hypothetical protein
LYNVAVDRGSEQGIIYKKNGLLYRVLDEKGNKTGVPIKASSIYNKPTLSYLENLFRQNELLKQEHKKHLKTSIDWILVSPPKSLETFKQALEKEKISLVTRQNDNGIVYGLTYIDHSTKCVFNGSDIGKEYSAKAILAKCGISQSITAQEKSMESKMSNLGQIGIALDFNKHQAQKQDLTNPLDAVTTPTEEFNWLPYELKKQKKNKRKSH